MNKKLVIALLIILTLAVVGYNYLYQDHRDVANSVAVASFKSAELLSVFTDNDSSNDIKALDQVIEVKGNITYLSEKAITMDGLIFIEMIEIVDLELGQEIIIKGRCLGYDDLMEEVRIDQGTIK